MSRGYVGKPWEPTIRKGLYVQFRAVMWVTEQRPSFKKAVWGPEVVLGSYWFSVASRSPSSALLPFFWGGFLY